jgi:hypothetical protein
MACSAGPVIPSRGPVYDPDRHTGLQQHLATASA